MEQVTDVIYYHIVRGNYMSIDRWNEGQTLLFNSNNKNHFFTSIQEELKRLYKEGKEGAGFYNEFFGNDLIIPEQLPTNDFFDESLNLYRNIADCLNGKQRNLENLYLKYAQLLREIILEKERVTNYPLLPSRTSCLWMCDFSNIVHWDGLFKEGSENYKPTYCKINVTGKLFRTDGELIDSSEYERPIQFKKLAEKYWAAEHEFKREEYLFEGEVTVVKKYDSLQELIEANENAMA